MIISSSEYASASSHKFTAQKTLERSVVSKPIFTLNLGKDSVILSDKAGSAEGSDNDYSNLFGNKGLLKGNQPQIATADAEAVQTGPSRFDDLNTKLQFTTLSYLFRLLFGKDHSQGAFDEAMSQMFAQSNSSLVTVSETYTYCEHEETSFSTEGTVMTADGREIPFNVSLNMSRTFSQTYSRQISYVQERSLVDPLIVNLDDCPNVLSDQSFFFDLNSDGSLEELASLGKGQAFLALDLNVDGRINNGKELFGTRTGNGFAELAQYDLDGNGWIDEADEIFEKLLVFSIDEDGNQKLVNLKDADIGAICLDSRRTDFNVTDNDNLLMGKIRSTGFFLHESTGKAGTISQVDLAAV